jgi:hypothetical protein
MRRITLHLDLQVPSFKPALRTLVHPQHNPAETEVTLPKDFVQSGLEVADPLFRLRAHYDGEEFGLGLLEVESTLPDELKLSIGPL